MMHEAREEDFPKKNLKKSKNFLKKMKLFPLFRRIKR